MLYQGLHRACQNAVDLDIEPDFGRLAPDVELVLFRIVQEALTTFRSTPRARPHASDFDAKRDKDGENIELSIEDAGRGMPHRLHPCLAAKHTRKVAGRRDRQYARAPQSDRRPVGNRIQDGANGHQSDYPARTVKVLIGTVIRVENRPAPPMFASPLPIAGDWVVERLVDSNQPPECYGIWRAPCRTPGTRARRGRY